MKEMAMHLKAARVNAGLTQQEVADYLGISKGTYANYENYKSSPNIEIAKKIAILFNMSVDDIIFFAE